jgi:hypothetical protein
LAVATVTVPDRRTDRSLPIFRRSQDRRVLSVLMVVWVEGLTMEQRKGNLSEEVAELESRWER